MQINDSILISYKIKRHFRHYTYKQKYSKYFDNINNSTNSIENLKQCNFDVFDVVFIDGMHHCENVLRDFNNSLNKLTKNGFIFIDDILPFNYNEQLKIPVKHYYENGVLKYGEEWTGDVWKFVYHLLKYLFLF